MLGARIAALRREAGLSQAALAERLQISPSAVGMYEQGRREPPAQTIVALARQLGVSTDFLLTGRAGTPEEARALEELVQRGAEAADRRLAERKNRPFSMEELSLLFAALLTDE